MTGAPGHEHDEPTGNAREGRGRGQIEASQEVFVTTNDVGTGADPRRAKSHENRFDQP